MIEFSINNKLNPDVLSFGVHREHFNYPFNAIIDGSMTYHGKPIYTLLTYLEHETDGAYVYENEKFIIYYPTSPEPNRSLFLRIKPFLWCELNRVCFYVSEKEKEINTEDGSLCFRADFMDSKTTYYGCLMTYTYYRDVLARLSITNKGIDENRPFLYSKFYEFVGPRITTDGMNQIFLSLAKSEASCQRYLMKSLVYTGD